MWTLQDRTYQENRQFHAFSGLIWTGKERTVVGPPGLEPGTKGL